MPYSLWLFAALVGHGFLWVEAVNRLHGLGLPRKLVDLLTGVCGLSVTGLPVYAAWRLWTGDALPAWFTAYANVSVVVLGVVLISRLLLRWDPLRDRLSDRPVHTEVLDLAQRLGDAATGNSFVRRAAALPGNQLLSVQVEHRDVPLDRLPPEWDGLRIAHLTDLHMSGRLGIEYFQAIIDRVNEWQPHLVCLTGDIVEHTPQLDWVEPVFGELEPLIGSYFILGNHDAKVDESDLRQRLEAARVGDVSRQETALGGEYDGLVIVGDERPWFDGAPDPPTDARLVVCLAHTPDRFTAATRTAIDLMLAGHCHGGQVCFPLLGPLLCPSKHGVRFASGTFRRHQTVMHASRGSGSLFPLRYLCPPEVGFFTLRSNASASVSTDATPLGGLEEAV